MLGRVVERGAVEGHVDAGLLDATHAEVRVVGSDPGIRVPRHRRGVLQKLGHILAVAQGVDLFPIEIGLGDRHLVAGANSDDRDRLFDGCGRLGLLVLLFVCFGRILSSCTEGEHGYQHRRQDEP